MTAIHLGLNTPMNTPKRHSPFIGGGLWSLGVGSKG